MTVHHCYILRNDRDARTYVGYTVNPARRLRQHNGEIKGGARFTTRRSANGVVWRFLAIVRSTDAAFNKNKALSLEWWLKHPTGHRRCPREYTSPEGRLRGLQLVLANPRFEGIRFQQCVTHQECMAYVSSKAWDDAIDEDKDNDDSSLLLHASDDCDENVDVDDDQAASNSKNSKSQPFQHPDSSSSNPYISLLLDAQVT